ncbi:hypothetical protein M422DRAFT_243463 [Sphaerobolus stellatus SS14]|nr:hypothetical protein M422DRAFT_243463 [Sphaerobolus stellatus SS14]
MFNIPNGRDIPPNAPRIRPILLPDVRPPPQAAWTQQAPQNGMPTPGGRAIPRNATVVPRQAAAGTTRPPKAPRMRPIPLPDV